MRDLQSLYNIMPRIDRWKIACEDCFVHYYVITQRADVMMTTRLVWVWVAIKALHAPTVRKLFLDLGLAQTSEINPDSGSYAIEHGRSGSLPGSGGICNCLSMQSLSGLDESVDTFETAEFGFSRYHREKLSERETPRAAVIIIPIIGGWSRGLSGHVRSVPDRSA
jgi:hypothetical protein